MSNIGPNLNQPGQSPMRASPQATPAPQTSATQGANVNAPANAQNSLNTGEAVGQFPLASLFATQQAMSANELLLLLRNLLQMPKAMVQLLALLANLEQDATQEMLQKLLSENPQIPLEELQQLLVNKADQCQEKLLKLMQSSHMDQGSSGNSMGELMTMLSKVTTQAKNSPTEALHSTLSLYLPYYPLQGPQRFSLHFEPLEDEEENGGSGGNAQLVIFIETIAMGQFRISMAATRKQTQLQVLIGHEPLPGKLLQEIEKQVQAAFQGENVPPLDLIFRENPGTTSRQPVATQPAALTQSPLARPAAEAKAPESYYPEAQATEPRTKPTVAIHPAGGVSALSIHAAYMLIRVILEIDTRHALLTKRAQEIDPA